MVAISNWMEIATINAEWLVDFVNFVFQAIKLLKNGSSKY